MGGSGDGAAGEGQLTLQPLDLGDIGEDFHDCVDIEILVEDRLGVDERVDASPGAGDEDLLLGSGQTIGEGGVHDAVGTS